MGSIDRYELHKQLLAKYKQANPELSHGKCDKAVSEIWKEMSTQGTFPGNVFEKIQELERASKLKVRGLDRFWLNIPTPKPKPGPEEVSILWQSSNSSTSSDVGSAALPTAATPSTSQNIRDTPKQKQVKESIDLLSKQIINLSDKKKCGMASDQDNCLLKNKLDEKTKLEKKLKALKSNQVAAQTVRDNKKHKLLEEELEESDPSSAEKLQRLQPGRPRIEDKQPEIFRAIMEIASYGAATDERRRSEVIRPVHTLKDLTLELNRKGFNISQQAVYYRLQPKRHNSTEGKRHVVTVPVRLMRSTNDYHKHHADTSFCKESIGYLEELASILGPTKVLVISQDDKARVPIGLAAANKEAPLLMHLEYRVRLPDHDWVVGERHKLIPSVYAICNVEPNKPQDRTAVGYSGPTFITIRSGKHSGSTAFSHATDLAEMFNKQEFKSSVRTEDGEIKPVIIIIVDGGPDENPRYEKVQAAAIHHFKSYNLDAVFVATNAPGRSAFNRVERRMAPLSNAMSGLILPHDHFGTHLNDRGKTVDPELEIKNFEHAGSLLAELFSQVTIDGFPTVARYIKPTETVTSVPMENDYLWRARHVREGHYFFQVIKCSNATCCSPMRSDLKKTILNFIPGPLQVNQLDGLTLVKQKDDKLPFAKLMLRLQLDDGHLRDVTTGEVPFDYACPSIQELIISRKCRYCTMYHASLKSLKNHLKICESRPSSSSRLPTSEASVPTTDLCARTTRRSVRIAAKRDRERLVVWTTRQNDEHADWFDENDLAGVAAVEATEDSSREKPDVPVVNVDKYLHPVWDDM